MPTQTISVPEVHCGHCVSSIEGALNPMDGVSEASVDLESRTVSVTFDDTAVSLDAIVTAIEDQGYDVPGDDDPARLPMA
jgi:copper chaperone